MPTVFSRAGKNRLAKMRGAVQRYSSTGTAAGRDTAVRRAADAVAVLVAACIAAIAAHLGIDALGDVVLARDSYDAVAHHSRFIALDAALLGATTGAWFFVAHVLGDALLGASTLRRAIRDTVSGSPLWFAIRVAVASVAVLALMGGVDALLDATAVHDASDLFGGSLLLGMLVTLPIAGVVAAGTWQLLRVIATAHEFLVEAIVALILLQIRAVVRPVHVRVRDDRAGHGRAGATFGNRSGNRAPPPHRA